MSPDALSGSLDRVTAVGAGWPWTFTRCWLLVNRFDHHGRAPADLAAALAAFAELPPGVPGRARLAAVLVNLHLRVGGMRTPQEIDPVEALATVADGDPAPFPQWPADRAAIRSLWLMISLQYGRAGVDGRSALAEIDRFTAAVGSLQPHARMIEMARLTALHYRARDDNDITGAQDVAEQLRNLDVGAAPGSDVDLRLRIVAAMQGAQAALMRGDLTAALAEADRLTEMRRELAPGDDRGRTMIDMVLAPLRTASDTLRGTAAGADTGRFVAPDPAAPRLAELRAHLQQPGLSPAERAMYLSELGVLETAMGGASLDDAVEHLREAVETGPPDRARGVLHRMTYGVALVSRFELRRRKRDLAAGVRALEQARELAGGPEHPHWATIGISLGHAYRLSRRRPLGNETGRDALRGHAWSVLLQSGTAAATAAARHAASEAIDVARWHLEDHDAAGAALALDAGRGLILQAAVQFSDVAERLTALGADDLAERWRRVGGAGGVEQAPIELRREVVIRLSTPGAGPADPPGLPEIRAALTTLDVDALVYLVPGEDGVGAAVVVAARDEPTWLPLPALARRETATMDRYLAEGVTRDTRSVDRRRDMGAAADDPPPWRDSLGEVCDWAWKAAMGPLLAHLPSDPAPRLVLVPMGELARVPWHAARDQHGHHAVQRAVFSYAVSARMLCDSAWAQPLPVTPSGLVIGDPDTGRTSVDLPAARVEAIAVRDAFYRRARYVGRTVDGTPAVDGVGSRAEVQRWLADEGAYAGTVLHAACHGVVEAGTGAADTSYLLLAGGERLAAEDLIRTLTTARTRGLALTVLAACSSGVPGRGYDEAFSLATAFLAGGSRAVISALWKVPDAATSVLMFVFHHFLRTMPAVDALRAAQLWMLRPDRPTLDEMPESLRHQLVGGDPTDIAAWAGFAHAGR